MELRVLRYFLMAAREENITRAAQLLHITQPTLSRQLMQLEEELGTKLFKRSNHSIYLTEDGMLLRKRAQDIVDLADRTRKEFTDKLDAVAGEIVIGSAETKCMDQLAKVMHDFQKKYPLVTFDMYTANADDIKERLDKGLADIGLLSEPVDISKYHFIRLDRMEKWGVLVREDSQLAKKDTVEAKELIHVPLIMARRNLVKKELESWFGETYHQIHVAATYNLLNNAASLVQNKVGAALCFDIGIHYEHLKFIPLVPQIQTGFVLVWRKNQVLSQPAHLFLDILKKYMESISEDK